MQKKALRVPSFSLFLFPLFFFSHKREGGGGGGGLVKRRKREVPTAFFPFNNFFLFTSRVHLKGKGKKKKKKKCGGEWEGGKKEVGGHPFSHLLRRLSLVCPLESERERGVREEEKRGGEGGKGDRFSTFFPKFLPP